MGTYLVFIQNNLSTNKKTFFFNFWTQLFVNVIFGGCLS